MPTFCAHNPPPLSNCALSASESMFPEAWDGLLGLWSPGMGVQGMSLAPLGAGQKAPFTNLDTSNYVYDQPGTVLDFATGANRYADTGLAMASMTQYTSLVVWRRRSANAFVVVSSNATMIEYVAYPLLAWNDGVVYVTPQAGRYAGYPSNDTDWHVLATRFDGSQATDAARLRAWHDGVEQALTFGGLGSMPSTSASAGILHIGFRQVDAKQTDGRIGTVAVWNRALPPALIVELTWRHMDMLRKRRTVLGWRPPSGHPARKRLAGVQYAGRQPFSPVGVW